jgi:dTDP-4-amino-4,6-dideoxygalactose transaminase
MNRNHGMTRSLLTYGINNKEYINPKVDSLFDFYSLGNNFRNTDLNAYIGELDFKRIKKYTFRRKELYDIYKSNLNLNKFFLPEERELQEDVPFCLPIIIKKNDKDLYYRAIEFCRINKIEYRPIISGYLGYQTCYKDFFDKTKDYPNSTYIHNFGFYVGLYSNLKKEQILFLTKGLNKL